MKQSRGTSFLKSCVSTAVGFGVAMIANALVLPLFGYTPSLKENFLITCIYTVISVARGYVLERIFEAMGWRTRMSAFAMAAVAERTAQSTREGYSNDNDDALEMGALSRSAALYLQTWFARESDSDKRRELIKATALLIAEGERFDRNRKSARRAPVLSSDSELMLKGRG